MHRSSLYSHDSPLWFYDDYDTVTTKFKLTTETIIITACQQTLPGQVAILYNNKVWSDILSDQRMRRDPKGLSCICDWLWENPPPLHKDK